jgi:quinoprotein glucose dehydrogenase
VRLDLLEAAAHRSDEKVRALLARYDDARSKDDPLGPYREALEGGNARRGRQIFFEKDEVSCLRCHKIQNRGGEVGPELTNIGAKQNREYLLEALVAPNRQIAQGFETLVVAKTDGQIVAGILKSDDGESLQLLSPEGAPIAVPKRDIEAQTKGISAMPADLVNSLSKSELRDLVEFLARQQGK